MPRSNCSRCSSGTSGCSGDVEGRVEAVRYTTAGPVLDVGGQEVMLADVRELRHIEATTPTDPTTDPSYTSASSPTPTDA